MIYRGEIYYGPEKKTIFVVYGTYENVGKALGMAETYIRMTRKYKYATCSHLNIFVYGFEKVKGLIKSLSRKLGISKSAVSE